MPCSMVVWLVLVVFYVSPRAAVRIEVMELQRTSVDECVDEKKCVRLVLSTALAVRVQERGNTQKVIMPVSLCVQSGKFPQQLALNDRFAYKEGQLSVALEKQEASRAATVGSSTYHLLHLFVVKAHVMQVNGVHHVQDSRRPPLTDDRVANFISETSREELGTLGAAALASALNVATVEGEEDEVLHAVVDLALADDFEIPAQCPALDETGNHAYTSEDNFKLIVFASGATCATLSEFDPSWPEQYCLSRTGHAQRGWAVPVDLNQAVPVVRNPDAEPLGARMWAFRNFYPYDKHAKELEAKANPDGEYGNMACRYMMYPPEQWLRDHAGVMYSNGEAKVAINTNFYNFIDVKKLPCGTPLGPVVSDGHAVQTWGRTVVDLTRTRPLYAEEAYNKYMAFFYLKVAHTLVMYKGMGAFIIPVSDFDSWFDRLTRDERVKVNAVTGHRILKDRQPIDQQSRFKATANEQFWTAKYARTAVGIQHDGQCTHPAPEDLMCGSIILLVQFEKRSEGATLLRPSRNKSMEDEDRPPSDGVTVPEMQEYLNFMMMDDAINFDGSGSSALWTSIGRDPLFEESRAQPSDKVYDSYYQFRPSPIHMVFKSSEDD